MCPTGTDRRTLSHCTALGDISVRMQQESGLFPLSIVLRLPVGFFLRSQEEKCALRPRMPPDQQQVSACRPANGYIHTVYETVKVGEADGVLGTSTDEHGKNVYTLSWEHRGITHTVMGNIPYDEIMKIAEGIR